MICVDFDHKNLPPESTKSRPPRVTCHVWGCEETEHTELLVVSAALVPTRDTWHMTRHYNTPPDIIMIIMSLCGPHYRFDILIGSMMLQYWAYSIGHQTLILCTFSGKPLLLSPISMYRNYNYGMFNRNFFSGYKNKSYYDDYVNFHDKYNFGLWNPCCITSYLTQSTSPDLLGPSAPLIWHQGCSRFSPDIK